MKLHTIVRMCHTEYYKQLLPICCVFSFVILFISDALTKLSLRMHHADLKAEKEVGLYGILGILT